MSNVEAVLRPLDEAVTAANMTPLDPTSDGLAEERPRKLAPANFRAGTSSVELDEIRPRSHAGRRQDACRTCEAAALFVDIVGYTRMSEALSPEDMLEVLEYFYESMTKVSQLYGGRVERYDGDALFVTFGTRSGDGQVATAALRCAFEMHDVVAHWSRKRSSAGQVGIEIGIGIDYGAVAVAKLQICGDSTRALQGDPVNVARKLEELTRELGACLAVSDRIVEAAIIEGRSYHLLAQMSEHAPRKIGHRIAPMGFWSLANA